MVFFYNVKLFPGKINEQKVHLTSSVESCGRNEQMICSCESSYFSISARVHFQEGAVAAISISVLLLYVQDFEKWSLVDKENSFSFPLLFEMLTGALISAHKQLLSFQFQRNQAAKHLLIWGKKYLLRVVKSGKMLYWLPQGQKEQH